ncbi:MAG: nuclear transport factor 2 family protein [Methanoregula sp.]|jgi:hypothetical protein|nr:nuclear transport factor 2 family protein [Methanoregula sp.]
MPGKKPSLDLVARNDPDQLKNLLLVLEHAHADAWLRRDRRALEALLAPDFLEINYFGRFTRDDLLVRFFPRMVLHTFTIEDPVLFSVGAGNATLTYQCYEELTVDGKKRKGTFHVSALYGWNGKLWKLLLWQITPFSAT